jgi:hypothetical protein
MKPQIPPLRYALLKDISSKGPWNRRSLGYPGFPVELGVTSELHAAFLNESRTRGPLWCRVVGNPGCAPTAGPTASRGRRDRRDDKGKGDASMESGY